MVIYDWAIIGNGLAAKCFLKQLIDREREEISIVQFFCNKLAPSASVASTAFSTLNGAKLGVSPLGDAIVDGFIKSQHFINKFNPNGVYCGDSYFLSDYNKKGEDEQFRRFNNTSITKTSAGINFKKKFFFNKVDAIFYDTDIFFKWFDDALEAYVEKIPKFVSKIRKENQLFYLQSTDKKVYYSKKLMVSVGAYQKIFDSFYPTNVNIGNGSAINGFSLKFSDVCLGDNSFVISINKKKLIYRHFNKELVLGGVNSDYNIYPSDKLHHLWKFFDDLIVERILPPIDCAQVISGIRHKNSGRRPFCGETELKNCYFISGLYKNGFSVAYSMAHQMVAKL